MKEAVGYVLDFGDPRVEEWRRTLFWDPESKEVFAPAIIKGPEERLLLESSYDGVGFVISCGHAYLPLSWLRTNYPDDKLYVSIQAKCLTAVLLNGPDHAIESTRSP